MDSAREKRREEISKALIFIQSSLAYPDPEGYQDFLTKLVCNLLDEGNTLFRDREWDLAVKEFSEGLNVSQYAAAEEMHIPEALLESLYVNRATAYHSMGAYDQGIADCDKALEVCKESYKALYRKALCLKELGKHKDAYNCTTECLLINRLDRSVNDLAQELAVQLGLKNRKPYVSTKGDFRIKTVVTNGNAAAEAHTVPNDHIGNGMNLLSGIVPGSVPGKPQFLNPSPAKSRQRPGVSPVPDSTMDTLDDCELMGEDLDSLLDSFSHEPESPQTLIHAPFSVPILTSPRKATAPPVLPNPTPQLPPAFFNSPATQLIPLDSFLDSGNGTSTLDALDNLSTTHSLDVLDDFPSGVTDGTDSPNRPTQTTLDDLDDLLDTTPNTTEMPMSTTELDHMGEAHGGSLETFLDLRPQSRDVSTGVNAVKYLDSLDSLDSFPSVEGTALSAISAVDSVTGFALAGIIDSHSVAAPIMQSPKSKYKERNNQAPATVSNPLSSTHEFMQACSACFPRQGEGIYTFVHKPDLVHSCKRDILLCRRKASASEWIRVRPIPRCNYFTGPYVLCKEIQKSGDKGLCKYREQCTFAFNQLEIDVWTLERKGLLDRQQLFETSPAKPDPVNRIIRLLKDHAGMFIFLCEACYDGKPTIISKRSEDDHTICSNTNARHMFDANKCLAFVIKTPCVRYRKVRPLSVMCYFDLCHHNIRYRCMKDNNCQFAHSDIELKTWRVQKDTGIKPHEIVKVSTDYYEKQEQNPSRQKGSKMFVGGGRGKARGGGAEKSLDMRMRFACAFCWRDGRISEPDKALKYCTAKAKHTWTKDRRVLLVMSLERSKWVMVRPLPHSKNFPVQYDICTQILDKGRCNYSGNCTFAHSQEEKKMWMYMKNNDLVDMQQIYDMWLSLSAQNRQTDGSKLTQSVPEDKFIAMPTDYAEPMSGFHCELCGKHSNSERQWQQHISTEKHKDRVFSCEGEDESLTWSYRFPARCFDLCPKLNGDCPDGVCCDYAHSPEELQEWIERRDLLRLKLAKARKDMLIMPHESDFGKYNFLLQD